MSDTTKERMPAFVDGPKTEDWKRNELHGKNPSGLYKLRVDGMKFRGDGRLELVSASSIDGAAGERPQLQSSVSTRIVHNGEVDIRCFDIENGLQYRFRGKLIPVTRKLSAVEIVKTVACDLDDASSEDIQKSSAGSTSDDLPDISHADPSSLSSDLRDDLDLCAGSENLMLVEHGAASPGRKRKSVEDEVATAELLEIGAARLAGLDPCLKLTHVCVLTGESRATIYRKIGKGQFPAAIKRGEGKGSFWRLSVIETYCDGLWQPTPAPVKSPNTREEGGTARNRKNSSTMVGPRQLHVGVTANDGY